MRTLPAPAPWSPPVGSGPVQAGQSRVAKGAPQQQQQHPHSSIPTAAASPHQHHHPLTSIIIPAAASSSPQQQRPGSQPCPQPLDPSPREFPRPPKSLELDIPHPHTARASHTSGTDTPMSLSRTPGALQDFGGECWTCSAGGGEPTEGMDEEERSESSKLRGPAPWRGAPRHAPAPWLRTRSQRVQSIHSHPSRGCSETELSILLSLMFISPLYLFPV